LVLPYAGVFFLILLAEKSQSWPLRFAVLPFIAALQMHLQILQHEGAHYLLCRNRKWNDRLAEVLCSIPFLNLLRHYRFFHLQHHRFLLDPTKDPEVDFYREQRYTFEKKDPKALAKMLFLDFCGYHYLQFFFSYNLYLFKETRQLRMAPLSRQEITFCALTIATLLLAVFYLNLGFEIFFYWFLPQFTILFLFLKLHGYGEHAKRGASIQDSTYAHELNPFIKFFIYPLNSDYHLEHHLDASIPWYQLPKSRDKTTLKCQNYFFGPLSIAKTVLLRKTP